MQNEDPPQAEAPMPTPSDASDQPTDTPGESIAWASSPLAFLTLPEQQTWLEGRLARIASSTPALGGDLSTTLDEALAELVLACLPLLDASPLEFLFGSALERGILETWSKLEHTRSSSLMSAMAQIPDSALLRLVRSLLTYGETDGGSGGQVVAIAGFLSALLKVLPFSRLPARCVVDRALQRHFPAARARVVEEAVAGILIWSKALAEAAVSPPQRAHAPHPSRTALGPLSMPLVAAAAREGVPLADASLLSAAQLESLRSRTLSSGVRLEMLEARLAQCTLEVLSQQPRGVSQANAEELLAKRVYTDPGHFLIELLQNAEDAGAHHWCLVLRPDSILVAHDGQAFDCRDVVGVTSIGQTTKVQQQIGMFGVGFKSVYEVTRRPRIRSGRFHFELVDVSVPRALPFRSEAFPEHWTLLELPLANPADPLRSAQALFAKACALNPSVLLTLQHLQSIELIHLDRNGGYRHFLKQEAPLDGAGPVGQTGVFSGADAPQPDQDDFAVSLPIRRYRASLEVLSAPDARSSVHPDLRPPPLPHAPLPQHQTFLVFEKHLPFDRTLRDLERRAAGRALERTRVLLGFERDAEGKPVPLARSAPQIYSWLPTAERPGLRFFIQAHLDVPVDRERASPGSAFNAWVIGQIPAILREGLQAQDDANPIQALLECLPLPGELKGELFEDLHEKILNLLGNMPILRSVSGTPISPAEALVLEDSLLPLLELHPAFGLRLQKLLPPSTSNRLKAWAASAGARVFGLEQLIDLLQVLLEAPGPDFSALDLDTFLLESQRLLEVMAHQPNLGRFLPKLRKLPLLPDDRGQRRPAAELSYGNDAIRSIYQTTYRSFIHPKLDVDRVQEHAPKLAAMLGALELQKIDEVVLASDLSAGRYFERSVDALVQLHHRLAEWVDVLSPRLWRNLALLPCWPDQTGRLRTLLGTHRALIPGRQRLTAFFPGAPFLDARVAELPHTAATQVARVGLTQLLLAFLPQSVPPLTLEPTSERIEAALQEVLETLEHAPDEVTPTVRSLLSTQPLLLDQQRAPVALGFLCRVDDTRWRLLLEPVAGPGLCFSGSTAHAVIRALGLPVRSMDVTGVWSILSSLSQLPADPAWAVLARTRLLEDAVHLPLALLQKAVILPIFPDTHQRLGGLTGWEGGGVVAVEPMWQESLLRLGLRVLAPELQAGISPILQALGWAYAGLGAVIKRLADMEKSSGLQRSPFFEAPHLDWFLQQLVEQKQWLLESFPVVSRGGLPPASPMLCALPLWSSLTGELRSAEQLVEPPGGELVLTEILSPGDMPKALSLERLRQLKPAFCLCPLSIRLQHLVTEQARHLAPLEQQPLALRSATQLTRVLAHQLVASVREPWHDPPLSLPLLDAIGRVRLDRLMLADQDTTALLLRLKPGSERADWREGPHPLLGGLLHPVLAEALGSPPPTPLMPRLTPLPDQDAVLALCEASLDDADLPVLWDWLEGHLPRLSASSQALRLLRQTPLFLTTSGRRVRSDALSADPLFDGTDLDVKPSALLGPERLIRIQAMLHSGRETSGQMATSLVLGAWRAAVKARSIQRQAEVLRVLAALVEQDGPQTVRLVEKALEEDPLGLLLPDVQATWRRLDGLCMPPEALREDVQRVLGERCPVLHPELSREPAQTLLKGLHMRSLPTLNQLCLAAANSVSELAACTSLCRVAVALAGEVEAAGASSGWSGWDVLSRDGHAWLLDGTGALRAPQDLFISAPELEGLIGTVESHPERFLHPELEATLGRRALQALPLLHQKDIRLPHVVAELAVMSTRRRPVGFRIYRWLEAGLRDHRLDPAELQRALAGLAWVCTDDGDYFEPEKVLGIPAWACFGRFRGYWLRGVRECPRLCTLFEIPDTLKPEALIGFFQEVAGWVARQGDRALLEREPALPRMLLACMALLGGHSVALPAGIPVILAEAVGPSAAQAGQTGGLESDPIGTRRLLPAGTPGLVRSATPALDAVFQQQCRYYRAILGPPEEREQVEACLACSNVPRLEDLIQVELAADAARERTAERGTAIRSLRSVLGSLLEVFPRVKRHRRWLEPSGWRLETRLRVLALNAPIRSFDGLTVGYVFPGVGTVHVQSAAVLEPEWQGRPEPLLALDDQALLSPLEFTGELAAALVPAIYEGAGAEQLVDILELLLPLATKERMHRYLDQRHYPHEERPITGAERAWERVSGLLDYGLARVLLRSFPWLERQGKAESLLRWGTLEMRDDLLSVTPTAADEPPAMAYARRAVADLQLERSSVPTGEVDALITLLGGLLAARDLTQALLDLRAHAGDQGAPDFIEMNGSEPSQADAGGILGEDWPAWESSANDFASATAAAAEGSRGSTEREPLVWLKGLLGGILPESSLEGRAGGQGVIGRLGKWVGAGPPASDPSPGTENGVDSTLGGTNPFVRTDCIGDNRWATPERLRVLAALPASAWLRHDPGQLVSPWGYAIRQVGVRFEPGKQQWLPSAALNLPLLQPGTRSGVRVRFQGRLLPGRSILPMPLYSVLEHVPNLEGVGQLHVGRGLQGRLEVDVQSDGPVQVQFRVTLLEPPVLGPGIEGSWGALDQAVLQQLCQPTLARDVLPLRLRRWITSVLQNQPPLWERALAGLELVRTQTRYDERWASQPRVQAAEARLRPGQGQHALERFLAGGDSELLGRGICFELNQLLVEVLRHLGVPAMPAMGWLLDQGMLARPDHLFALALLPSPTGPLLLPLDASIGPAGARSALRFQEEGAPASAASGMPLSRVELSPSGVWSASIRAGAQRTSAADGGLAESLGTEMRQQAEAELEALYRARSLLKRVRSGLPEPGVPESNGWEAASRSLAALSLSELEQRSREERVTLEREVGDPHRAALLLRLIRGELPAMTVVTPEVQTLIQLGVARIRTQSVYQVVPVDGK